jgi:hypothetical protein
VIGVERRADAAPTPMTELTLKNADRRSYWCSMRRCGMTDTSPE